MSIKIVAHASGSEKALMFKLTLRTTGLIPIEVDGVIPEGIAGLSELELAKLPILHGNRREALGEHFTITHSKLADIHFAGDTAKVKRIAAKMTSGTVYVENSVGMHAGAEMSGGTLILDSSAGDWCGAEMRGGKIEVRGNTGNQLGAAYRGSRHGMRGGIITVEGDAGDEAALLMRRGMIAVKGRVGRFAGATMIAGTLVALGGAGSQCGAGMKRGTIVLGSQSEPLPKSFRYSCEMESAWLGVMAKQLRELGYKLPAGVAKCYRGDVLTGAKGEVLVIAPSPPTPLPEGRGE